MKCNLQYFINYKNTKIKENIQEKKRLVCYLKAEVYFGLQTVAYKVSEGEGSFYGGFSIHISLLLL